MNLSERQRKARIKELGEPVLRLEFDVFENGEISMWTHFDHSGNFQQVKEQLIEIRNHLQEFLNDEGMCPFHKQENVSK